MSPGSAWVDVPAPPYAGPERDGRPAPRFANVPDFARRGEAVNSAGRRVGEIARRDEAVESVVRTLTMHVGPDQAILDPDLRFLEPESITRRAEGEAEG